MSCADCAAGVTENRNSVDGVSAGGGLSKGRARISCDREIGDDLLRQAVEKAGYHVANIT